MSIEMQFVDFPKSQEIRDVVSERFAECLDRFELANEIHLNLVFKHVHFTTTELTINVTGDKIHQSIHVDDKDIPHALENGVKKLNALLRKMSDKKKANHRKGRERRGHTENNEFS
jgi:ribosome-associated translation inhibitor RaiA